MSTIGKGNTKARNLLISSVCATFETYLQNFEFSWNIYEHLHAFILELIWRLTIPIFPKISYRTHETRMRIFCDDHKYSVLTTPDMLFMFSINT